MKVGSRMAVFQIVDFGADDGVFSYLQRSPLEGIDVDKLREPNAGLQ